MAGTGFEIYNERSAGAEVIEVLPAKKNVQFSRNCALKITTGFVDKCGATDKMSHVYQTLIARPEVLRPVTFDLSHATLPQDAQCVPVQGRDLILKSKITTIPISDVACNSNSNTALVLVAHTTTTSSGDFDGGTVYCNELDQTRRIVSSTYSAGVHTLTLDEAFTTGTTAVALTTTHTVRAVPVAAGVAVVKFLDETSLDLSVAGKSGGYNKIEGLDLKNMTVLSSCPFLS